MELEVLAPDPAEHPSGRLMIRLNHDPPELLVLVPGIGDTLARRIVDARRSRGPFRSLEEVKELPGVPDAAIDRAAPWLTLLESPEIPELPPDTPRMDE